MSFRDIARTLVQARTSDDRWMSGVHKLDAITRGVAPHEGSGYEPNQKADAYVQHVSDTAAHLRERIAHADEGDVSALAAAARALLAAIGEAE